MPTILHFTNPLCTQVTQTGGKGASLAILTQAGITVPPGFVIPAAVFEVATKSFPDLLKGLDIQDSELVQKTSQQLQELVRQLVLPPDIAQEIEAACPPLVAVRSSATVEDGAEASWAGELESFLNVEPAQVLQNVLECWASLYSPRALVYRVEKGFAETQVSVAVVIQEMVDSEVAGVAFSVHPVTENPQELVIEAVYGLGESLVSGTLTPDNYIVNKSTLTLQESFIAGQEKALTQKGWEEVPETQQDQPKLSEQEVKTLARQIIQIEEQSGRPCDIEWALKAGKFYILQNRPITTLSA